ncbi:tryptophan 2,3-dioxygenase family protein [Amycolatopsis cihanbeyliensis]|uniref:Tryptophan 2,3-dioxygenase n=1 Tax=Amycolatopsis cihanbeyliensis TaxID=1128664 RepID=A0A542DCR5_AMYCI|nr:tryptophan 2,3-dioxygenase family protein [Amycolatopsis cihanbeyliensis]TQJ00871.1 tryptophan 2,3-dioxygenase [Amycolatopsis cihanbeyliensis]
MVAGRYGRYLRLGELLGLQRPRAAEGRAEPSDAYASEHLFIVVQQASELLLRQVLLDLGSAVEHLESARPELVAATRRVERATAVIAQLTGQLALLWQVPQRQLAGLRCRVGAIGAGHSEQVTRLLEVMGLAGTPSPLEAALLRLLRRRPCDVDGVPELARSMKQLALAMWSWQARHAELAGRGLHSDGTGGIPLMRSRLRIAFPRLPDLERWH